jgi:ribosome maturation factor RimP
MWNVLKCIRAGSSGFFWIRKAALGDIFDIREVVNGAYTLEVSSPGLDRPISRDQDFVKYKNSKVNIKTGMKIEGIKNFHGTLADYIEDAGRKFVLIDIAGKIYRIPKQDIAKANLADAG